MKLHLTASIFLLFSLMSCTALDSNNSNSNAFISVADFDIHPNGEDVSARLKKVLSQNPLIGYWYFPYVEFAHGISY